eukprot:7747724-Pyramimonas_sp.AAC.1
MAGGLSHINQCTISLEGLKSVPEAQGRVIARHVNGVVPGGCVWLSVYFYHSQGVSGDNVGLLAGL